MRQLKLLLAILLVARGTHAATGFRDLDTPRTFPEIQTREEWQSRARLIREHVLVSCGLWPLPERAPLNAKIFDRVEREGYSVEKVYFETYPGFFLAGNLYRPLGKGAGPFPGTINPHGHSEKGRLTDTKIHSTAARCISFARLGMIAFSYDMVGYNDTVQVPDHRAFATQSTNLLWNISLMGLQTWNSVRALDFLETLPDVDRTRLACTGESGGGTQTFMLGAVDDRLAAQAPMVMVSHSMQGGCLCENAPGLRVDYSNMEIAAVPAPRPQILVAATGDWTRMTMTVEGPAVQRIYDLLGAGDHFRYRILDYVHNSNRSTREQVSRWFGRWLLHNELPEDFFESAYTKEPDSELLVFPDRKFPAGALSEIELLSSLVMRVQAQIERDRPRDDQSLAKWKEVARPAWEHSLQLQHVRARAILAEESKDAETAVRLRREPEGFEVNLNVYNPKNGERRAVVIISSVGDEDREGARKMAERLRTEGFVPLRLTHEAVPEMRNQFTNFFSTYNRTVISDRVAELKVAAQYAREKWKDVPILIVGQGTAGLAALAAAPLVAGTAADCSALDDAKDENLLDVNAFFPGLRRLGSFQGIAALAAPAPLLLHNTAGKLNVQWLGSLYGSRKDHFRNVEERASEQVVVEWLNDALKH